MLYHIRLIDCSTGFQPRLYLCCILLGVGGGWGGWGVGGGGGGSCYPRLNFLCNVLQIVVCPFILCAIVLPVLRFTDLASSNSSFKYIVYMFTIIPWKIKIKNKNKITASGLQWLVCSLRVMQVAGPSPDRAKRKTINLICVATAQRTQR